tara:strand:+ start:640 stop:1071 length:432 start_codon:yes stop_codon:yes gene_type:complete
MKFKILGIEHVGIAIGGQVGSLFWKLLFDGIESSIEEIETEGVETEIFNLDTSKVELLKSLHKESPVSKFISKKGPGIHHVCIEVDSISSAIIELKNNNIKTIKDEYTIGAEGFKVIFVHPKYTGGVLVELAEKPKDPSTNNN